MKKFLSVLLVFCILTAIFTGCQSSEKMNKITVSEVTHSIFYAPMYVALNKGYFEEENIEIEIVNAGGADKVMTSLLTKAADIGFAGPEAVIYVYAQGKEDYPKVFAQLTQCDGSFLIGRDKVDDFKWEDLKGSTILPGRKGGIPYMTLLYCLNKNGLEVGKDVFFDDSISFNAMTGAFVSGTGDYVTAFEPGATAIELENKGFILASVGEEGGKVPYTTYFANSDYLEENKELVQKFTDAIYRGQKFVENSSAKEIAEVIAPSFADTDIKVIETVVQRYKDIGAYSKDGVMSEEEFKRLCNILENAKELSSNVNFEDIIDNSFAQKSIDNLK